MPFEYHAKVTEVVDGDTIVIDIGTAVIFIPLYQGVNNRQAGRSSNLISSAISRPEQFLWFFP